MSNASLIFPNYSFKTRQAKSGLEIWDEWRKKWLVLTPEELVRQHLARYLVEDRQFPSGRLALEYSLEVNQLKKRADMVIFDQNGKPQFLVECKAPDVAISAATFDQVSRYNIVLQVPYIILTNGLVLYCAVYNFEQKKWDFLSEIPLYINS